MRKSMYSLNTYELDNPEEEEMLALRYRSESIITERCDSYAYIEDFKLGAKAMMIEKDNVTLATRGIIREIRLPQSTERLPGLSYYKFRADEDIYVIGIGEGA